MPEYAGSPESFEKNGLVEQLRSYKRALTVVEVAELFACSNDTVYRMIASGRLPYFRFSGSVRFDSATLIDWLRKQGIS